MTRFAIAALIVTAAASGAIGSDTIKNAQYWDGNKFYDACTNSPDSAAWYALGAFDGFNAGAGYFSAPSQICIPKGVTWEQIVDTACHSVEQDATTRHWPAAVIISISLMTAFPCS